MKINTARLFRHLLSILLCWVSVGEVFPQIGVGVKLGGNLSHADAFSFRSSNRLGFQVGGALRYHFHRSMAIQAEPAFNLTRIRANGETVHEATGIDKGNKALYFFELPVLFRLDITPGFALLGGAAFNKLLNEDRHLLNNGEKAFKGGYRLGYSLGLELGKFYFRYRILDQPTNVSRSWNANVQQYQVGIKWDIL